MATPLLSSHALTPSLTLAQGLVLVSWWKPILILAPLIGWAWIISKVYDKHAARFFLARRTWNLVHLVAGALALLAALAMPMRSELAFWIGWLAMLAILAADLAVYPLMVNRDKRVPEAHRVRFSMAALSSGRSAGDRKAAKAQRKAALVIKGPDKQAIPVPDPETPEYEVRTTAEALYIKLADLRASQVDILPSGKDNAYQASFLVDGVRVPGDTLAGAAAARVMDFWKAAARLDVADRRRKLTGDVTVEHAGVPHKIRVTSIGAAGGMRVTLLIDPEQAVTRAAKDLGLLEPQMTELKSLIDDGKGVVLIGAPPDGGRTSTLYAVVRMHDAYTSNVQTLEMEPQTVIEGVRQNPFDPQSDGADYGTTVRSILRRDPDVLAVAEMPDAGTAKEVAKADLDRSRVYLAVRADSAIGALDAYLKAVGDNALAAKGLRGVVAQRLLRKLCQNCRVPYPPSADMLKGLGVAGTEKVSQLFKKGGQVLIKNKPDVCPVCGGGGYFGQTGAFEVYQLGEEERALVAAGNIAGLRAALRKRGVPGLQQAAIRKALDGITSVDEVKRITAPPPESAGREKSTAAAAPAPGAAS